MGHAADPLVLITGASTGIGLALARLLAAKPYRLLLTARRSSLPRFEQLGIRENSRIWVRPLDVTSADQRGSVMHEAESRWGGVDVLVNNAGLSYRSVVEHVIESERFAQMDVNYLAPMELVRLALPSMREKRAGRIINVSSVAGMMAMPTMAEYSASKFALEGASEALWYEVRSWNIHVTLVQPGFVDSAGFEHVRLTGMSAGSLADPRDPYHAHYVCMGPFIARMMRRALGTPESVARCIHRVMRKRRPPLRVAGTPDATVFDLLRRWFPRWLYHRVLYASLPHVRKRLEERAN